MKQEGSWTLDSENQNIATQFYLKKLMVFPPQLSSPKEFILRGMLRVSDLANEFASKGLSLDIPER